MTILLNWCSIEIVGNRCEKFIFYKTNKLIKGNRKNKVTVVTKRKNKGESKMKKIKQMLSLFLVGLLLTGVVGVGTASAMEVDKSKVAKGEKSVIMYGEDVTDKELEEFVAKYGLDGVNTVKFATKDANKALTKEQGVTEGKNDTITYVTTGVEQNSTVLVGERSEHFNEESMKYFTGKTENGSQYALVDTGVETPYKDIFAGYVQAQFELGESRAVMSIETYEPLVKTASTLFPFADTLVNNYENVDMKYLLRALSVAESVMRQDSSVEELSGKVDGMLEAFGITPFITEDNQAEYDALKSTLVEVAKGPYRSVYWDEYDDDYGTFIKHEAPVLKDKTKEEEKEETTEEKEGTTAKEDKKETTKEETEKGKTDEKSNVGIVVGVSVAVVLLALVGFIFTRKNKK